jgi:hypothetical protein
VQSQQWRGEPRPTLAFQPLALLRLPLALPRRLILNMPKIQQVAALLAKAPFDLLGNPRRALAYRQS